MCLEASGHEVVSYATIDEALAEVARRSFDMIFLDLRLGTQNGLDFIPQLRSQNPWTRIVIITAYASVESAVEAMKRGASDYLAKPFEVSQVRYVTEKVAEKRKLERRIAALQTALDEMDPESDFPTADPAMAAVIDLARRVAPSQANLVISGEMGTGKARLAHAIHIWSDRAQEPFAAVSCRADPGNALEGELFGAAGEGSESKPTGKVEFCDGGTLLLDEIGDLPLRLQPSVLRLLKEREFERQDDNTRRRTNVRIIATTSTDLQEAVDKGTFRTDLLLALNVVQIDVPALRNRPQDIPLLAERYAVFFGRQNHRPISGFSAQAMHVLTHYQWPGNVRELKNVVERATLLCQSHLIGIEHLPPNMLNSPSTITVGDFVPLAVVEELHVRQVVASAKSMRQAATILGIDSGTVSRRLKRYESNDERPPE
jgi:NtrC-family two-component system response regulator AlgB